MPNPPADVAEVAEVVELAPASAAEVFGSLLPLAQRYAELLSTDAVVRGLIGPREPSRIWSRHLLNSAVVAELIPPEAHVVDVGTGAGLPGIPLALAKPDLRVMLLEPLQRRTVFLDDLVATLGLGERVSVHRGRAEDAAIRAQLGEVDIVVARAVAPLDRLVRWCVPLLRPGGWLLALKGQRAAEEVAAHRAAARLAGVSKMDVVQCGLGLVEPPTAVIRVQRDGAIRGKRKGDAPR